MTEQLGKMKILGSPFFAIILLIIFIVLLVHYWKLLKNISFPYKLSLISLRSATVIILILLLINPWVDYKKSEKIPQNIDVIIDLSESMNFHFNTMEISSKEIINEINNLTENKQVNINFYRLGEKIRIIEESLVADGNTDFTNLSSFIGYENPNQVVLITDGKATVGGELNNINFPNNIPIHTLGIGPTSIADDLAINRVNIPPHSNKDDTVKLVININSHLQNDAIIQLDIKNDYDDRIFTKSIRFDSDTQNLELEVLIPAFKFSGVNKATITSLQGEHQLDNNQYSFRVNVQSEMGKILLISGALSPNTSGIKSILHSLDGVEIDHHYRIDAINWNMKIDDALINKPKLLVFDDFPTGNNDKKLFDKLVKSSRSQHIPIVYMEGPKSNLTTGEIIRSQFSFFTPTAIESDIFTSLSDISSNLIYSDINLSSFPPQARSVRWTMEENDWVNFSDGSFMIANKNDVYMVAMPSIIGNHLKTQNNTFSPIFSLLNKLFLHAFYGNEGMLSLHVNGTSFNKGEIISTKLIPIENLGLSNFNLTAVYSNLDTITTDCIQDFPEKYYNCKLALHSPGEYRFIGEAELPNGQIIYSKYESIIVQAVNNELKELVQEQKILMQVAHKSDGIYMPIESLDSMFANIEITPLSIVRNHQLSGITTQNYWWVLILLLSIEWFLRKNLGLL